MPEFIDLSHPLSDGLPSFPGDPQLAIKVHNTLPQAGYNLTKITMGSHQGTHLDAPFHFFDDGKTLDRIELGRFYGPARMIDLPVFVGVTAAVRLAARRDVRTGSTSWGADRSSRTVT